MAQSYRFGDVEVRPAERQLLVGGQPASVGARAFDVLIALIDHRDRVVTKNELLDMVWPGLVVEENNLQVQVSSLRKVLGARSVATIPGRGYRFTLEPEPIDGVRRRTSDGPRRHNLPAQLNSFIGREREIGEIRELFDGSRLVTLTSMGGTGKTRLSLQVAASLLHEFSDGVWFVELAPLADERRVPQTVASVLGVTEEAGRPVLEALVKFVHDRRLLLVLDNCEHLLHACADLAKAIMLAGAQVKILASSREQLHVTGEKIYTVPALGVPNWHPKIAIEALVQSEAVRLFIDRTVAVQPSFKVTFANAAAVAEVCRRLDGIPLAIELAAARMRALSVEAIAGRLADCFRLLTGGDTTAMSRQQTLRASIDWSYDLLAIPERELLRRLSVFSAGFTLEAAEAICTGGDVEEGMLFDLLSHLVDKSLVVLDSPSQRYSLLETVRQYAQELLRASGEEDATRNRHLDYYSAMASAAKMGLVGPQQAQWLAKLDIERENLLASHAWCEFAPNGPILGFTLASGLKHYCMVRGQLGLANRITVEALERAKSEARGAARCSALFDAGQLDYFMGRYAEAQRHLEESLAIARELGDERTIARALQPLGLACVGQGDLKTARRHVEEALELAGKLGDKRQLAAALNAVAQLHRVEGDLDSAELLYENFLAQAREIADSESVAIGHLNLAMVAVCRARASLAGNRLLEALAIVEEIGSRISGGSVLEVCAGLGSLREEWETCAHFYGAAEGQAAQMGAHRDPTDEAFLAPLVAKARHALAEARYREAEQGGRSLTYEEAIGQARTWLEGLSG